MLLLQKTCNLIDIFINGEQRIKTHRYKQNILYNCFHTTRVDLLIQQLVRCFKCSVYALSRKLLSSIKGQINARSCVFIKLQTEVHHFVPETYKCNLEYA